MSKIDELQQKRSVIEEGGGSEMVKKQHDSGKKTARERLACLFDEGSFIEIDELKNDGVIAGYGTILSRPVCVFAQDSSVMSGAITSKNCEKICKIIDMAIKTGVPLIGFYDSIGSKIDEHYVIENQPDRT